MKKLFLVLFWALLLGTLFTWINFSIKLYEWISARQWTPCTGPVLCIPPIIPPNPFLTIYFFGAVLFTVALAVIIWLLNRK